MGGHQRGEGDPDQQELHLRGRHRDGHELRIAAPRSPERQHGLHDGDAKGEDQGIVTELCDHGFNSPWAVLAACRLARRRAIAPAL